MQFRVYIHTYVVKVENITKHACLHKVLASISSILITSTGHSSGWTQNPAIGHSNAHTLPKQFLRKPQCGRPAEKHYKHVPNKASRRDGVWDHTSWCESSLTLKWGWVWLWNTILGSSGQEGEFALAVWKAENTSHFNKVLRVSPATYRSSIVHYLVQQWNNSAGPALGLILMLSIIQNNIRHFNYTYVGLAPD